MSSSGLDMSVQSWSLSVSGRGKAPGADQARRLTSSTEADWGGRSLGGPGGAGSAALRRSTPVQQARKRRAVTDSFVVCVATETEHPTDLELGSRRRAHDAAAAASAGAGSFCP